MSDSKHNKDKIITFLRITKDGKYAKIDENSLKYARINEVRQEYYQEEEYYYGIR
jgi:hypothetical protein